ncbi:CD225/dispanin family protein [Allorhizocola rhizosphaerae]|uniref:CD225/dispanin family protein n=1 Tax=Allorhizocola rhizosphaerae TaxID=1872709 RepID=UPI0013C34211|nr:CD225/dispanin family protein [Allorhizocola rhizosphaerae]
MTTPSTPVNNNLGWGIAGLILFWPVGLFALIKAIQVGSKQAAGDIAGAQASADSAKKLGKIAVIVGAVLIVLYCLIFVVLGAMMSSTS